MASRMLVPEKGLTDTRRNRRWLALTKYLDKEGMSNGQESAEFHAWKIIKLLEETP